MQILLMNPEFADFVPDFIVRAGNLPRMFGDDHDSYSHCS